ncbi:MAG: hypothetical protein GC171_16005 [Terrimonas sp.]|nr:hypothetical protein [Terrimonas sp.]
MQKITLSQLIIWFNRIALATVFCWFGFLKVIRYSPAEELVAHLHRVTLVHVIPIEQFLLMLGLFECLVGVLWLIPKATRLAFCLFMLQMITTFFPLIFLKGETWQNSFALTLTGQYIIKNFVLVASALTVLGSRFPKKTWGLQNA